MAAQPRELLKLDLDALDLRKGLMGLASLLAFGVFVAIYGNIGMVAALATLFVIMADQPGPLRDRGIGVLVMTVVGSLIALVGIWAGPEHLAAATILTFVVVALATLAASLGAAYAVRGMLLAVWAVVAIGLAGEQETATQLAVAFAGGGLIAAGVIWLRTRAEPAPSVEAEAMAAERDLTAIVHSSLGWFSLLRAAAAGIAMWLGATLFPEHAMWAALTVILVMKPRAGEAVASGILRTLGTLLGVLVAEVFIAVSGGGTAILLLGFLLAAFAMAALQKVNYALFVACLTTLLVLSAQLATGSGEATASDRLLATLLGAIIAFIAIALGWAILGRPLAGAESGSPAEGEDRTPG